MRAVASAVLILDVNTANNSHYVGFAIRPVAPKKAVAHANKYTAAKTESLLWCYKQTKSVGVTLVLCRG